MNFSIAISLLILFGCATTQTSMPIHQIAAMPQLQLNADLLGRWKGVHKEKSETRTWYMDRYENGVFHLTNFIKGKVFNEEFGLWSADLKKYSTTTLGFIEESKLTPDLIPETYDIQKLNKDIFEYKNLRTGNVFRVTKVSDPIGIPPNDHFSKVTPTVEVFNNAQLTVIDLLRLFENNQSAKAYDLFCNDQKPPKEDFEQSIETMNKVYGYPRNPHSIKVSLMGARVSESKVHPTFSFWIKSHFDKPNTFIRIDLSYFDKDNVCVLTYSPVNFANDNIPPDLK